MRRLMPGQRAPELRRRMVCILMSRQEASILAQLLQALLQKLRALSPRQSVVGR